MFQLPPLPYAHDALEPAIGAGKSLEALIEDAAGRADRKLFDNAAQAWNHAFLWESMAPAATQPQGALVDAIARSFGDLARLRTEFVAKGLAQFGSGWVWLVADGGRLEVVATHDAGVPWLDGSCVPLLVCDVWEHAYYLDYRNERDRYLGAWFDRLANWQFAARQLAGGAARYRFPMPAD
ncbi:MAG TPA: superoxide dismutase [Steroidobacteraceae bacterium]|nr:superoxide dismutase [Steroidobacteraceae bacterium]